MKSIFGIIALIIVFAASFNIAEAGGKIMLKGNVYSKSKKEPLDVNITFKSPDGKQINTNSNGGKYELLLDAGVKYDVYLNSKNTVRYQTEYLYNTNESYIELTKDFHLNKIEKGAVLNHVKSAFTEGELNENAKKEIDDIMKILRFNRTIYLTFYVISQNTSDTAGSLITSLESYMDKWKRYSNKIENIEAIAEYKDINAVESDIIVVISSVKDPFGK